MTLRTLLILINIAAVITIIVIVGAKVLSVRREPTEKPPPNQTPFYDDDVMEDTHLTRVLRWALVFSTIVAVVLPLYWLLEPNRQAEENDGFDEARRRARRDALRQPDDARVRQRQVAAVRQLPRRRRERRRGDVHPHARRPGRHRTPRR